MRGVPFGAFSLTLVSRQVGYVEDGAVLAVVIAAFVVVDVAGCVEEAIVDVVVVLESHAKQPAA